MMETEDFENKLLQMTKPEVSQLMHQDMLADAIVKAKDKFVLSAWWLCVPMYIIAAFVMKSFYMPQATLASSMHEFADKQKLISILFFVLAPIAFIILNFISLRTMFKLSGNIKTAWLNALMILLSLLILFIYIF